MKAYQIISGAGLDSLKIVDFASRPLGDHDVRVAMRAAALNHRDLKFAEGHYIPPPSEPRIPLCDGVGEVVEVGGAVTRLSVGDRVIPTYWPDWIDGAGQAETTRATFGAHIDGTLTEELVIDQEALVHAPAGLDDAGAATITCAGVTAWNALFVHGDLKPGATVMILGTGGVSIWALQLAHAAGLHPIVTSSSDDKLARADAMGARATINYRVTPEWQREALRLTDGRGVDAVVEVGGRDTLPQSIEAVRYGGRVVVIGGLSGFDGAGVAPGALVGGAKTLVGMSVGNRRSTEDLVRFIEVSGIKPVVDHVFAFAEARAAYDHLAAGRAFGKVVTSIA